MINSFLFKVLHSNFTTFKRQLAFNRNVKTSDHFTESFTYNHNSKELAFYIFYYQTSLFNYILFEPIHKRTSFIVITEESTMIKAFNLNTLSENIYLVYNSDSTDIKELAIELDKGNKDFNINVPIEELH